MMPGISVVDEIVMPYGVGAEPASMLLLLLLSFVLLLLLLLWFDVKM